MQTNLEHFRALARKLDADRLAWNATQAALSQKINDESARLYQLQQHPKPDKQAIANALRMVRTLKKERADLRAPSFVNQLPECEKYARTHATDEAVPIQIKIPQGQTALAAHNNYAEKTDAVLSEIQSILAAPIKDDTAIERQVDALAKPPRVVNGRLFLPKQLVRAQNGAAITLTDVEGLFAWLNRDALIKAAKKLAVDAGPAMTPEERQTALNDLYGRFATALRCEAAAAMQAEKDGQTVVRRRHVHPAVLLGTKAAPAAVFQWHAEQRGA